MSIALPEEFAGATPLKAGGQKSVYRFDHPHHGNCVIKIGAVHSANQYERIRREVETLKEIDSYYYPKIYEFKKLQEGEFLIIEEYIESKPLSEMLTQFSDARTIASLGMELVRGLEILWNKRIVHRDLKPDNILILHDGSPRIIDLGIARLLDSETLTQSYAFLGTRAYAAPEQIANAKAVDMRADQFNLGIILAQLMNKGVHPFDPKIVGGGSYVENISTGNWDRQIVDRCPDAGLGKIVSKLLGDQPYKRYRASQQLKAEFYNIGEK